jgi:hypothetical protein
MTKREIPARAVSSRRAEPRGLRCSRPARGPALAHRSHPRRTGADLLQGPSRRLRGRGSTIPTDGRPAGHPEAERAVVRALDPHREEAGIAAVRNGLALCKIHHAAYDSFVLGIRPDLVVEIRADLLEEIDGPMLEHGLKGRHGQRVMVVPKVRAERPDRNLLDERYTAFRSAG